MTRILVITLWLLLAQVGLSQDVKPKAVLQLFNRSVVHCEPEFKSVKIEIKHGSLEVPLDDIVRINIGYHVEPALEDKLNKAIKDLSSTVHSVRETADKFLRAEYEVSYNALKFHKSPDREVSKRISQILEFIRDNKDAHLYDKLVNDEVYLRNGGIYKGKIYGQEKYSFATKNFGKIQSDLAGIREMVIYAGHNLSYKISEITGEWQTSGIVVSGKFTIKASGRFDLWPQEPERYTSTANGAHGVPGKNSAAGHQAGTLLIRYNGNVEKCGESYTAEIKGIANLEFMIVPLGWTNQSEPPQGFYKIETVQ